MANRTLEITYFADSALFAGLGAQIELARLTQRRELLPGEILVCQGDQAKSISLITGGLAYVDTDGEKVSELGPGAFIGEVSLFTTRPMIATVTAVTMLHIVQLERRDVERLFDDDPQLCRTVMSRILARLQSGHVTEVS